jgi:hypothetical protein
MKNCVTGEARISDRLWIKIDIPDKYILEFEDVTVCGWGGWARPNILI